MGSTTKCFARDLQAGALALSLALGALAVGSPTADAGQGGARIDQLNRSVETTTKEQPHPVVWRGACYCKMGADRQCTADLTEHECTKRCKESLCDDWFWLERRLCWNWGYGG